MMMNAPHDNHSNNNNNHHPREEQVRDAYNYLLHGGGGGGGANNGVVVVPKLLAMPALAVDPSLMMLSEQEWTWARTLKRALQESDRFESITLHLSDMEITQHALAAEGNVVEAMVRIEGLEQFKEFYGIDHSLEQAMWLVSEFMKQQPGYLLHFDVVNGGQQSMMVTDSAAFSQKAAFDPTEDKTADENWRICVAGIYYLHWILHPTFASMRQGIMATVECDGVGWHNFRAEYVSRLFEEMFSYLPIKFQCIRGYNTTVVANLLFSLARPFMGQNMKQSVQLGFQIGEEKINGSPRRLSEFYLQPSLEAAQVRQCQRIQTLLMIRLVNDKQFRL